MELRFCETPRGGPRSPRGKPVRIRHGPAAVSGDESRIRPLPGTQHEKKITFLCVECRMGRRGK